MPFSNTLYTVPTSSIVVNRDDRQRTQINTEDLEASIAQNGLINPIIVQSDFASPPVLTLVAGERRLEACRRLGWTEVPVRLTSDLSPIEAQIIELEENAKREELPWQDLVRAVAKIHTLHKHLDPLWTQLQTAEVLSMSEGQISLLLIIHPELSAKYGTKFISECTSYREAYNLIKTERDRRSGQTLSQLLDDLHSGPQVPEAKPLVLGKLGSPPLDYQPRALAPVSNGRLKVEQEILNTSFLEWAPTYSGAKFSFIHCDFPYGQLERGPQQTANEPSTYEDSPAIYLELLDCFCTHLDNFFSTSGWIMFWYSNRLYEETLHTFTTKAPSLSIQIHPLIWLHSDNVGISPDPRRRPRHVYDTCLILSRGDIPIATVVSDGYHSPTERSIHPSCKPVPMLKHFFRMFIDQHTSVLDPTCGSGAALRAAEELGAHRLLGLELNPDYCESARSALKSHRDIEALRATATP